MFSPPASTPTSSYATPSTGDRPAYSRTSVAASPMYRAGGRRLPQPQGLVDVVQVGLQRHVPPLPGQPSEQPKRVGQPGPRVRPRLPERLPYVTGMHPPPLP